MNRSKKDLRSERSHMSMGAHAAFMRKKGDHEMQSEGGALQLMACRVRVVRIAHMIGQPKYMLNSRKEVDHCRDLHLKRGNKRKIMH